MLLAAPLPSPPLPGRHPPSSPACLPASESGGSRNLSAAPCRRTVAPRSPRSHSHHAVSQPTACFSGSLASTATTHGRTDRRTDRGSTEDVTPPLPHHPGPSPPQARAPQHACSTVAPAPSPTTRTSYLPLSRHLQSNHATPIHCILPSLLPTLVHLRRPFTGSRFPAGHAAVLRSTRRRNPWTRALTSQSFLAPFQSLQPRSTYAFPSIRALARSAACMQLVPVSHLQCGFSDRSQSPSSYTGTQCQASQKEGKRERSARRR